MTKSARLACTSLLLVPLVTGCPVTDDYFIESGESGNAGTGGSDSLPKGGSSESGSAPIAGSGAQVAIGGAAGGDAGQPAEGGANVNEAGKSGSGGGPPCTPTTERCNGRDDDCDGVTDEEACNSPMGGTFGCSGFVVEEGAAHGYMFCNGMTRDYDRAQSTCQGQGMRLAWLETKAENEAVWAKVIAIQAVAEVWIGATDRAKEGSWSWDGQGGVQFWEGDAAGAPVDDAYVAWATETPNNSQGTSPEGEDCAVLLGSAATWGDRTCTIKYSYLCEDVEP
jgi:hypothetical protein